MLALRRATWRARDGVTTAACVACVRAWRRRRWRHTGNLKTRRRARRQKRRHIHPLHSTLSLHPSCAAVRGAWRRQHLRDGGVRRGLPLPLPHYLTHLMGFFYHSSLMSGVHDYHGNDHKIMFFISTHCVHDQCAATPIFSRTLFSTISAKYSFHNEAPSFIQRKLPEKPSTCIKTIKQEGGRFLRMSCG